MDKDAIVIDDVSFRYSEGGDCDGLRERGLPGDAVTCECGAGGDAAACGNTPRGEATACECAPHNGTAACDSSLRGISLRIKRGECVLLCGESGCGKTTLTRLLNGLIPHFYEGQFSGKATVMGNDTAAVPPDALAHVVGSVFQNPRSQFFNLDTTGELAFGCENLGMPPAEIRKRISDSAAELGIEHLLERDIFALSGGEKQLIAIASAYALSPDVFVFDEPSSNLDWNACKELARLMLRLKQAGKTLIVAEHRIYWLTSIIDRVVYMREGQIAETLRAAEFLAMPEERRRKLGLRAQDPAALLPTALILHAGAAFAATRQPATAAHTTAQPQPPQPPSSQPPQPPQPPSSQPPQPPQPPLPLPPPPTLQVSKLSAWYKRGRPVLLDVSFCARPGEAIAILGGNGAGKTTLARSLCGLHKRQAGSVMLKGKRLGTKARPGVFYLVMQESGYQLFCDSVEKEVLLSKNKRSRPRPEKVAAILESLALGALKERHPMSLSGGQRQRTAIATAMAHDAEVLIFDEPTSGLDYANMRRVVAVIEQLRKQGKTVFVITHDYELLLAACTRVLVLRSGCLKEDFVLSENNLNQVKEFFT
jgi:energy-coupling factor transport system ATP-binding protein